MPRQNRQNKAALALQARDGKRVAQALRRAIDGALCAYVAQFGLPDLPAEGLDVALQADPAHRAARKGVKKAWARLEAVLPDKDARQVALKVEEAFLNLAVSSAAVGWRLGLVSRGTGKIASPVAAPEGRKGSTAARGAAHGKAK